jgi:hypothetical protein
MGCGRYWQVRVWWLALRLQWSGNASVGMFLKPSVSGVYVCAILHAGVDMSVVARR